MAIFPANGGEYLRSFWFPSRTLGTRSLHLRGAGFPACRHKGSILAGWKACPTLKDPAYPTASQGNFLGKPFLQKRFSQTLSQKLLNGLHIFRLSLLISHSVEIGVPAGRFYHPVCPREGGALPIRRIHRKPYKSFCRRVREPGFYKNRVPGILPPLLFTALLSPGRRNHPQEFPSLRFAVRAPIDRP